MKKIFFLTILITILLDFLTKFLVQRFLLVPIDLWFWQIKLHQNEVLAWGIPLGEKWPTVLSALALTIFGWFVWKKELGLQERPLVSGLILGGGIANFLERLFLGSVTDFIDPGWFPAFNLADMAITVGAIWLLVLELKRN